MGFHRVFTIQKNVSLTKRVAVQYVAVFSYFLRYAIIFGAYPPFSCWQITWLLLYPNNSQYIPTINLTIQYDMYPHISRTHKTKHIPSYPHISITCYPTYPRIIWGFQYQNGQIWMIWGYTPKTQDLHIYFRMQILNRYYAIHIQYIQNTYTIHIQYIYNTYRIHI